MKTVLRNLLPLVCGLVSAMCFAGETADPRQRTFVDPVRIVWQTNATDAAILLGPRHGQIPEGRFLSGSGCTLEPTNGAPSAILLDFGRELHGGIQIGNGLPRGRKRVRVRFGESVGEAMAELDHKGCQNDHAIRDQELSLPWLGQVEFGNTGFRFVRIDALSEGPISIQFVRAVSLMRPMERVGDFRCSDERVNRVFETAVRTAQLCSQDYLWDGIKRDRLVWQGDMHPEVSTLLAVFGGTPVIRQSLDYMIATTPTDGWMNGKPSYTMWWILCLRDDWMTTGDLDFVRRHADYFRETVRHLCDSVKDDGDWFFPDSEQGFLDWPTEHNRPGVMAGMRGLYVWSLSAAAELGRALGDRTTVAACDAAIAKLKAKKPSPAGAKSAAALLALGGVRDAKEMFAETLGRDGIAGVSTFYGYYMLEAMSAADEGRRALDTVRDYWGAMLDMGATSFWEDFNVAWTNNATRLDEMPRPDKKDIHGDFGEFCYVGYRHSLCHGWSSGPAAWLIRHVLGARIVEPGGAVVEVKPFLGDLAWAEGALATAKGPVKIRIEKGADGRLLVRTDAPAGVTVRCSEDPEAVVPAADWPAEIRASEPVEAKRAELAPGVEYGFVRCRRLFGHPGDVHVMKIDWARAKLRAVLREEPSAVDGRGRLLATSAAAREAKALFGTNGGFFRWKELIPYYRAKRAGTVLSSVAGGTSGIAFSDDGGKFKVGRVTDAELKDWDNFLAGECLVAGGKVALDWKRPKGFKTKPDAPRTFYGMSDGGRTLWIFVTCGRQCGPCPSMGLSYLDAADLSLWFGCEEAVNIDGGGSSTLVVRGDLLKGCEDVLSKEAHLAENGDYEILNWTSDGKERAVLDQILFLPR